MTPRFAWTLVAALAAGWLAALSTSPGTSQDAAPAAAPAIRTVVLSQCFERDRWTAVADAERQYKEFLEGLNRSIEEEKGRVEGLMKELERMDPKSVEYEVRKAEIETASAKLNEQQKQARETAVARYGDVQRSLYKKIRREIEALAAADGYDFVLMAGEPDLDAESPLAVGQQISRRPVLFCHERFDVTAAVLARLNERYPKYEEEPK